MPTTFVSISSSLAQAQRTSHVHPPYALCSMALSHQPSKVVASKLYPASIVPIILQNYLWTRCDLTLCPRGAAVGSIAQTISILLAVPLVAATKTATGGNVPFIAVDWLHGIEQLLMALPSHVMAMSFRQAALSHEDGKPLPESAKRYGPMLKMIVISYVAILGIGLAHKFSAGTDWISFRFLGGTFDPPTPGINTKTLMGAPSFAVWIPHWSMFIDFATQLRYMSRWGRCLGIHRWKSLAILHFPWALANLAVFLGHLHKDQCEVFKILHPLFIFLGGITILIGTIRLALYVPEGGTEEKKKLEGMLRNRVGIKPASTSRDWDVRYSLSSVLLAAVLSYVSLYSTALFS